MKLFDIFKKSKNTKVEKEPIFTVDTENYRNCKISKYNILDGNGIVKYESDEENCILMTNIKRYKDMEDYLRIAKSLAEDSGYDLFMQSGLGSVTAGISEDSLKTRMSAILGTSDIKIINRNENITLDNYRGYPEVL